mmetsp:Transcript_24549/g.39544  ORF Transcript_24549/g.39544 Transcript_24549/m.39544 type:complete len:235 (-) Transcript_24549:1588-2292(-)
MVLPAQRLDPVHTLTALHLLLNQTARPLLHCFLFLFAPNLLASLIKCDAGGALEDLLHSAGHAVVIEPSAFHGSHLLFLVLMHCIASALTRRGQRRITCHRHILSSHKQSLRKLHSKGCPNLEHLGGSVTLAFAGNFLNLVCDFGTNHVHVAALEHCNLFAPQKQRLRTDMGTRLAAAGMAVACIYVHGCNGSPFLRGGGGELLVLLRHPAGQTVSRVSHTLPFVFLLGWPPCN